MTEPMTEAVTAPPNGAEEGHGAPVLGRTTRRTVKAVTNATATMEWEWATRRRAPPGQNIQGAPQEKGRVPEEPECPRRRHSQRGPPRRGR
jgi:hypothetical protein